MALVEAIGDPARRAALVKDCVRELDAELDERSGLSAVALRTAYKSVKKLRPSFVEDNVSKLLPGFAPVLDRHHQSACGATSGYFATNAAAIAEDLLNVTDGQARQATNKLAVSVYERLRPKATDNVIAGMPRLAGLVEAHA